MRVRWIIVIGLVIVLAGCVKNEKNYKKTSFFFNGVPSYEKWAGIKKEEQQQEDRKEKAEINNKKLREIKKAEIYPHPPCRASGSIRGKVEPRHGLNRNLGIPCMRTKISTKPRKIRKGTEGAKSGPQSPSLIP